MNKTLLSGIALMTFWACACSGPDVIRYQDADHKISMSQLDAGNRMYRRGCYRRSLPLFFEAFERFTAAGRPAEIAMCLNNIANAYHGLGELDTAIHFYDEACAMYTAGNDPEGTVHALADKAMALLTGRRTAEARTVLRQAEQAAGRNHPAYPLLSIRKGILHIQTNEFRKAEEVLNRAMTRIPPRQSSLSASVNYHLGTLMMKQERFQEALDFFRTALQADRSIHYHRGIADDLSAMGDAMLAMGNPMQAASCYKRGCLIYALIDLPEKQEDILKKLENIALREDVDLTVVRFFLQRWRNEGRQHAICD